MNIFKKKLEDEEPVDEVSSRKIRDLKPENRKVRKEPPKPWGKVERYIVLIALLITILAAVALTLYSNGFRIPNVNFDFGKINIFKSDTIIIDKQ